MDPRRPGTGAVADAVDVVETVIVAIADRELEAVGRRLGKRCAHGAKDGPVAGSAAEYTDLRSARASVLDRVDVEAAVVVVIPESERRPPGRDFDRFSSSGQQPRREVTRA